MESCARYNDEKVGRETNRAATQVVDIHKSTINENYDISLRIILLKINIIIIWVYKNMAKIALHLFYLTECGYYTIFSFERFGEGVLSARCNNPRSTLFFPLGVHPIGGWALKSFVILPH